MDDDATTQQVSSPLRIGRYEIATPVVLAPMAGVTNSAFRRLCREYGDGYYVSQMVTSRALLERTPESMRLVKFDDDELPRSLQLYGVDPATVGAAVRMVVEENLADHIDLNFGCPVAKVTRRGGGAALPWKLELFTLIVRAAVTEATRAGVPVTVKMRIGIDDEHVTYLDAGKIAESEGVSAVALHARTAAQFYSGSADWSAIAQLKDAVRTIPVLGNGDIWSAEDAIAMMNATGCDGVVVGRGCLGRPWLFADLEAGLSGRPERVQPGLGDVIKVMKRHALLLVDLYGDELGACRDFRKHVPWYLKGYPAGREQRIGLMHIDTVDQLSDLLDQLDHTAPYPGADAEGSRGRKGSPKRVSLPDGWLQTNDITKRMKHMMRDAEESVSGG